MIGIIDYGMGNLRSVANAFSAIGADARVVSTPAALFEAQGIVLPGVGAFGDGMRNLHERGFVEALEHEVRRGGKPLLGLCLGLQLLAERGSEYGDHRGLGWISGRVDRLQPENASLRIPHIGWNDVRIVKPEGLYAGLGEVATFYFVHSFALRPSSREVATGVCDYGGEFVASVAVDNIAATQFHPEKSHKAGLALLKNWCGMVDRS